MYEQQECIPVGCVPSAAVAVSLSGGGSASVHAGIPTPRDQAPPRGQTDACENITFATSLRTVNMRLNVERRRLIKWIIYCTHICFRT